MSFSKSSSNNPAIILSKTQAKERIGQISTNVQGEKMQIIHYQNAHNVDVKFLETGNIVYHQNYSNFIKGSLLDKFLPTCFEHGIVGNEQIRNNDGNFTQEYLYWTSMLKRCYGKVDLMRYPSYQECVVDKEWLHLSDFSEWFKENYYKCGEERMCLDKDILLKGNKIYSKDTCIFVPERINILFTNSTAKRGDCPIGVHYRKCTGRYIAQISKLENHEKNQKKVYHIGVFSTPEEAFYAYKTEKERYIKEVADYYKNKYPSFPEKLYNAMYDYSVEETD